MAWRVVLLGDSIGAMQGIPKGQGFVDQISARLQAHGGVTLENWSVGGALASGTVQQLPQLRARLGGKAQGEGQQQLEAQGLVVVIELGGNDRLFGLPPGQIEEALEKLARAMKEELHARVLLMEVVPDGIERDVAARCGARLVPTPPRVVATMQKPIRRGGIPKMSGDFIQPDGIHPNAKAQRHMASALLAALNEELGLGLNDGAPEVEEPPICHNLCGLQ